MKFRDKLINHVFERHDERQKIALQQAKLTVFKEQRNHIKVVDGTDSENTEYEIVEREIFPMKIICPDCGGETLEGLDYCDKCGGELN